MAIKKETVYELLKEADPKTVSSSEGLLDEIKMTPPLLTSTATMRGSSRLCCWRIPA